MNDVKKQKLVRAFKVIGFLLSVIGVLSALYFATRPQTPGLLTTYRTYNADKVFAETDESLDAVFMGHSAVYHGISPMELYNDFGMASYDYAQPLMMAHETKQLLKDLLKKQKPKVLALNVDYLFYDQFKLVFKSMAKRVILAAFPFYESHLAWRDGFGKPPRDICKGYVYRSEVTELNGAPAFEPTDEVYEMKKQSRKSLNAIYDMCKENGVELVLFELPGGWTWSYSKHNCIKQFADEKGLKFLDMFESEHANKIGLDWNKDMRDTDHLNYSGASKTTRYMGEWLKNNFDLPDRRGDEKYAAWNDDLASYKAYINERVPGRFDNGAPDEKENGEQ